MFQLSNRLDKSIDSEKKFSKKKEIEIRDEERESIVTGNPSDRMKS